MSDDAPIGQRTLSAPEGCGFHEEVVLPIRIHLMCQACKIPMLCTGPAKPSLIMAGQTKQNQRPKFGHMCPACKNHVVTEQPWPQIRHETHPHIAINTPEAAAEEADAVAQKNADIAAIMEASPPGCDTRE